MDYSRPGGERVKQAKAHTVRPAASLSSVRPRSPLRAVHVLSSGHSRDGHEEIGFSANKIDGQAASQTKQTASAGTRKRAKVRAGSKSAAKASTSLFAWTISTKVDHVGMPEKARKEIQATDPRLGIDQSIVLQLESSGRNVGRNVPSEGSPLRSNAPVQAHSADARNDRTRSDLPGSPVGLLASSAAALGVDVQYSQGAIGSTDTEASQAHRALTLAGLSHAMHRGTSASTVLPASVPQGRGHTPAEAWRRPRSAQSREIDRTSLTLMSSRLEGGLEGFGGTRSGRGASADVSTESSSRFEATLCRARTSETIAEKVTSSRLPDQGLDQDQDTPKVNSSPATRPDADTEGGLQPRVLG